MDGSTGNFGLQDQRLALEWVRDHIRAFDGNPERVFLVGESAGAGSVSTHLVMERSWGLFSHAGMESGGFADWVAKSMRATEASFAKFAVAAGCSGAQGGGGDVEEWDVEEWEVVECLVAKSTEELLRASYDVEQHMEGITQLLWAPTVDYVEMDEYPFESARRGAVAPVPILIGTVRDEGASFLPGSLSRNLTRSAFTSFFESTFGFDANQTAKFASLYPEAAYNATPCCSANFWAADAAFGDYLMACPAQNAAAWLTKTGQNNTFVYDFLHAPFSNASDPGSNEFAFHSAEIPYVFHVPALLDGENGTVVANTTSNAWINFAVSRNPNHGDDFLPPMPLKPEWPTFQNSSKAYYLIDVVSAQRPHYKEQQCLFWEPFRRPDDAIPVENLKSWL